MDVETNSERVLERPGQESINVKLADNTGKKHETAKRPRRKIRRFRNVLGRKNYTGTRIPPRRRQQRPTNENRRRPRGLRPRRRGLKIIIRNLNRTATNSEIKSIFEKIGPLRRCGINWNNLGESRGTAEVEYLYRSDAFRACRKLDYKSIKGVPMRLEIREGQRRISLNRTGDRNSRRRSYNSGGARRFRNRNSYNRNNNGSGSGVRNRSFSQRNSRRGMRNNRRDRGDGSRSDRRYRNY
jgi:RNA recognition motif-containing protein